MMRSSKNGQFAKNRYKQLSESINIAGRTIGAGSPTYIIAELSANHHHDIQEAIDLVHAAADAGADAIKLQTYTPDTMTIESDKEPFQIRGGLWDGRTMYDLYKEAYTPWEWHPKLAELAAQRGMHLFSTPFDISAVDYLEQAGVPAFKNASFEITDIPLLRHMASKGKPIILSTGMANMAEIEEALDTIRTHGDVEVLLLHCISSYPAPPEAMHLRTIPHLKDAFQKPVGLSDHTLGIGTPVAAVALGACAIEKHFVLSRKGGGPDAAFSMEPDELKSMVDSVRIAERSLGSVRYGTVDAEQPNKKFRRSLFAVLNISAGERLTPENVRVIRPGDGLAPRHIDHVLGRTALADIERGTPITWDLVGLK